MGVRERVGLVHRLGFWHGVWCAGGGDDGFQFRAIDGREHRPSPESVSLAASPDEAVRERAVQIESIRPRFVPVQEKCAGTELAFDTRSSSSHALPILAPILDPISVCRDSSCKKIGVKIGVKIGFDRGVHHVEFLDPPFLWPPGGSIMASQICPSKIGRKSQQKLAPRCPKIGSMLWCRICREGMMSMMAAVTFSGPGEK